MTPHHNRDGLSTSIARARAMPWRVRPEVAWRLLGPLRRTRARLRGVELGGAVTMLGRVHFQRHRGSRIVVGKATQLRAGVRANPLNPATPLVLATRSADAEITVGQECGLSGCSLVAERSIHIGDRVLVGAGTLIVDSDFHALEVKEGTRRTTEGASRPVHIGDDCFIGARAIILKGTRLGAGSVVGAGCVVSGDHPPFTMIRANGQASSVRKGATGE